MWRNAGFLMKTVIYFQKVMILRSGGSLQQVQSLCGFTRPSSSISQTPRTWACDRSVRWYSNRRYFIVHIQPVKSVWSALHKVLLQTVANKQRETEHGVLCLEVEEEENGAAKRHKKHFR